MSMTKSLSVLTLALSAAASAEPAETLKQQVDELYAALNNSDTPGCAVGVIHRGNYIHTAGYGMANLELGVALDADSVFRIGSVSKQFTAMAVHLMAQDGLIDLDADIHTYLPDLVNYDTEVTIRTMLGHVSGLPDYEDSLVTGTGDSASAYALQSAVGGPFRMGNADYLTIAEFYDVAKRIQPTHAPLTKFEYSNLTYFLFSMLVEEVTGKTLREYADARIFQPLGMSHSLFSDNGSELIKNRATGYKPDGKGGFATNMTNLYWVGDGGVHTSLNDFLLWERNFRQPQLGKDPAKLIAAMNTPNSDITDGEALYGNGQGMSTGTGEMVYEHSGWWLGFASHFARYPERELSVVSLCNDDSQDPEAYAHKLVQLSSVRAIVEGD